MEIVDVDRFVWSDDERYLEERILGEWLKKYIRNKALAPDARRPLPITDVCLPFVPDPWELDEIYELAEVVDIWPIKPREFHTATTLLGCGYQNIGDIRDIQLTMTEPPQVILFEVIGRGKRGPHDALIEEVQYYPREYHRRAVSDAERETQRQSFAYGNTKLHNSRITRELIKKEADRMDAADGENVVELRHSPEDPRNGDTWFRAHRRMAGATLGDVHRFTGIGLTRLSEIDRGLGESITADERGLLDAWINASCAAAVAERGEENDGDR